MRELKVAGKSESLLTSLVERAYIPVVAILALVQAGFQVEILEIYPKLLYSKIGVIQQNPHAIAMEDSSLNGIGAYIISTNAMNGRWYAQRAVPKDRTSGFFRAASFSMMWNLSSSLYGWALLMSDNVHENTDINFVFGKLSSGNWIWYTIDMTKV